MIPLTTKARQRHYELQAYDRPHHHGPRVKHVVSYLCEKGFEAIDRGTARCRPGSEKYRGMGVVVTADIKGVKTVFAYSRNERRIEVRQKRKLIAALTNDNDRAEIDALFKRLRAPRKRP